ncbi:hypothetical protein M8J77_003193 [Diaphorina citri]|nr:hypothetical protein M8J77_003193 [Diaphorina citri]
MNTNKQYNDICKEVRTPECGHFARGDYTLLKVARLREQYETGLRLNYTKSTCSTALKYASKPSQSTVKMRQHPAWFKDFALDRYGLGAWLHSALMHVSLQHA